MSGYLEGVMVLLAVNAVFAYAGFLPLAAGQLNLGLAGFAAYQWLSPTGPSWWVDQVQRLDPPSWEIGATLPSFAVSFVLALAAAAARFTRIGMVRA